VASKGFKRPPFLYREYSWREIAKMRLFSDSVGEDLDVFGEFAFVLLTCGKAPVIMGALARQSPLQRG